MDAQTTFTTTAGGRPVEKKSWLNVEHYLGHMGLGQKDNKLFVRIGNAQVSARTMTKMPTKNDFA